MTITTPDKDKRFFQVPSFLVLNEIRAILEAQIKIEKTFNAMKIISIIIF